MRIRSFQELMKEIYFHHDSRRGLKATFNWLKAEVEELGKAMEAGSKADLAEEFADVFAWLSSLANLVEVDIENACLTRYPGKCPKCGGKPCLCQFRDKP